MSRSISKNAFFKAVLNVSNIILPIIVMPIVLSAIQDKLNGYMTMGETWTAVFYDFCKLWGVSIWFKRSKQSKR